MNLRRKNKYLQNLLENKGGGQDDEILPIIASAITSIVNGGDVPNVDDTFLEQLNKLIEKLNKNAFTYNIPLLIEKINIFTRKWKNEGNNFKCDDIRLQKDNYDITIQESTTVIK
jgi:hypothetical protein